MPVERCQLSSVRLLATQEAPSSSHFPLACYQSSQERLEADSGPRLPSEQLEIQRTHRRALPLARRKPERPDPLRRSVTSLSQTSSELVEQQAFGQPP